MFSVKEVFKKTYPAFYKRHKIISAIVVAFLRRFWHEAEFQQLKADNSECQSLELIDVGLQQLNITLDFNETDLENIPKNGSLIIVCNHPTGAIEGIGLLSLLLHIRTDIKLIQGNILRDTLGLYEHTIEVDNLKGSISPKSYRQVISHLSSGGGIIMFPAGEVSRYIEGIIQDKDWNAGFIRFAKATKSNVLPIYMEGRNSNLFYFLGKYCKPLSMLRVVPELLLQRGKRFPVYIGQLIPFFEIERKMAGGMSEEEIVSSIRNETLNLHFKPSVE